MDYWPIRFVLLNGQHSKSQHDIFATRSAGNESKSSFLDQYSCCEYGQIFIKVDKNVSFKFLCSWPFQSIEIKCAYFYQYKLELHGELLNKILKKWYKPDTSTPQAFFVSSPLLKLSLITKKLAPMDEDLYGGDVSYNIHQLYSLIFWNISKFLLNFKLCFALFW